jgi:hypothetical protein
VPQQLYFDFLDRPQSKVVLAEAIRNAFSDLFAINTKAQEYTVNQAKNKLRTLFAGKKTDLVIKNIAKTFKTLCDYADFSTSRPAPPKTSGDDEKKKEEEEETPTGKTPTGKPLLPRKEVDIAALQYNVNIVLPETRDQAVYDALFRSLRDHLG